VVAGAATFAWTLRKRSAPKLKARSKSPLA
jgi:hypothetical protein